MEEGKRGHFKKHFPFDSPSVEKQMHCLLDANCNWLSVDSSEEILKIFVLMSSCIMSNWGMGKSGVPKMAITGEGSHLWEWPGRLDTRNTNSAEGRSCHSQPGPPRHCGNDKNDKRQPAMLPLPEDAARLPAGQHLCCLPWHGCGQQAQQTSPPTRNLESAHCGWMAMAGQKM